MAILEMSYLSRQIQGPCSFTAVLPVEAPWSPNAQVGYREGPWPTIYLLHGYTGGRLDWLRNGEVEELSAKYGCAVIMPDGGNSFYVDSETMGMNYGRLIGEELVEVTRNAFNLSHRREDTLIGGFSMGGCGSLLNGLRFPETFGGILALSSALVMDDVASGAIEQTRLPNIPVSYYRAIFGDGNTIPGSDLDIPYMAAKDLAAGQTPRLFLACGTEDFLYEANVKTHHDLESAGFEHVWWTRPGVHDFKFWNMSLRAGLEWYFGR